MAERRVTAARLEELVGLAKEVPIRCRSASKRVLGQIASSNPAAEYWLRRGPQLMVDLCNDLWADMVDAAAVIEPGVTVVGDVTITTGEPPGKGGAK